MCGTTYTGTVPIITSYTNYNINGISWTVEGTATAALNQNIDGTKGAQIGTGKAPANSLSFSTSGINGTITSITINTSGAKDVKANVSVTIGGSAFGGEAKTITNSAANYTFTGSASGNVVISWSQSSSKALYVKTITIEYSVGSIKTLSSAVSPAGSGSVELVNTSLAPGATTSATATANDGYEFRSWEISGTGASLSSTSTNPTTVTMGSADATVTANFSCVTPTFSTNLSTAPVNYTTGASASALTVAASANNASITYLWQSSTNGSSWSSASGTNNTANYTPSTASAGTMYYRCIATNAASGCSTSATSNVATIIVSAPTPATITLQNYDGDATMTGYYSGGSFTLPSENDFVCGDLTFVGWSSVTINDPSATKPASNYYEPGESVTLGASNTFYAVFANASGGGGAATYTKVTTISAGTYLMAIENATQYTPTSKLAYTGDDGSGKRGGVIGVSISDGVISSKPAEAKEITVTLGTGDDAEYFAMHDGSKYLTQGEKNAFSFVDEVSYQWNLNASGQIHQKGTFDSSNDNRIYLDHGNSGSQTNLFKPMKARTEGNNSGSYFYHAYLFKKSSTISYSNYTTNCQACVAPDHVDISGRWDRFGGETISLTAAAYASAGTGSPIADGNIREWQWEKLVGSTWTPLSNGTVDGVTISGATTKNLQIANCNGDNSGKYRCVVSTGATCSTASNGFQVKVYVLECYTGGTTTYNFTRIGDTQAGTCQINLAAGNHAFKFHADNDYYGNKGTINEDVSNWVCSTSQGNLTIAAGLGGTFTINMEYSTSGSSSVLGEPEISVTYPRKTIYLTPGVWNTGGAKFAFYYFRKEGETIYGEGFTDFITADDCGSYAEIPQWNGVKINAVRLNSNTTASDLTNSANHYKAAWDKKWNQTSNITVTSNNSISITGWGPQNGDSQYDYGTYSTPTYTISYAAGTGGSGTRESETKTCGVDFVLPNSAVFTRTGYKQTGWATEDGGSNAYDLGESYTTNAAQTFYPFWTEATYTVTLTTNGGSINAGNVTSYVYGTGATLPTNVTKDHATFQGWYASSTFEGERVYSIGASEFGNKQYYAKWEAITYTVTWKANGSIVRTDSNVAEGGKVASVPSAPADLTTDPNGCDAEFVGWAVEANDPGPLSISTRTTAPTGMFTDVAGSPTITGNVTFVAIYRQEQ